MATTDYAAAIDTNEIIMSYGPEAQWGVNPGGTFQDIRLDSEGFSGSKSRTRPNEINSDGQASAAITTKEESTGSLNFSLSAGTHNELLASSLASTFSTPLAMVDLTTIGAATATGFTDSANGFVTAGIVVGQMIKVSGFVTAGNNGVFRVDTVAAGSIETTPKPAADEAATPAITIKGSMLRNGKIIQSFFFQKQLAADKFLTYAGAWPTGGTLDVAVGDYMKGTLNFLNKAEEKAVLDSASGHTAAPTGKVIDSINGIGSIYRNGSVIDAIIQKIGAKWEKGNARAQYGIGSASAKGIGSGLITVTGSLGSYFKDFALYDEFKNETGGPIWFQALDSTGKGYVLTFCNATIMNPKIVAGGPGQDVMAEFEIEGNPDTSGVYGGKTIQIDYFN